MLVFLSIPHLRHGELRAAADAGRPSRGDRLHLGVEPCAFGAVHMMVTEEGSFPAAEAVIRHRHRDRDVDPNHADLHLRREIPRRIAVAGKDGTAIAVFVFVHQVDRRRVVF